MYGIVIKKLLRTAKNFRNPCCNESSSC